MQENNFEKEVRQKASELKIKPSEEVWQKVAATIGKRKTDRRVFAYVLLMLLFIGSALFIVWDKTSGDNGTTIIKETGTLTKNESKRQQADTTVNIESDLIQPHEHAIDSKKIDITQPVTRKKGGLQTAKKINIRSNKVLTIASTRGTIEDGITSGNVTDKRNSKRIKYETGQKTSAQIRQAAPADNEDDVEIATNPVDEHPTGKMILLSHELVNLPYKDAFIKNKLITDGPKAPLTTTNTGISDVLPAVKITPDLKPKSSWQFGLNLSAGIAATRNGYLGIIGPGSWDESKAFADIQSNSGTSTSNTAPPTATSYVPSKISSGMGFSIGFHVQRNVSAKAGVSIGLNYKRLSSAMSIGSRVDTGVFYNQYNSDRVGSRKNYHNHFNFIELPVSIHYRISKSHQLPVYLNTGISISQLLSSDALQFDTQSGNYYSNNALFNKTQLNVAAGLLFALSRRSNNSLLVGPDINFSLTKMAATGLYKDRRYSYFGILLHKKIGKK